MVRYASRPIVLYGYFCQRFIYALIHFKLNSSESVLLDAAERCSGFVKNTITMPLQFTRSVYLKITSIEIHDHCSSNPTSIFFNSLDALFWLPFSDSSYFIKFLTSESNSVFMIFQVPLLSPHNVQLNSILASRRTIQECNAWKFPLKAILHPV